MEHAATRTGADTILHLVTIVPTAVRNTTLASMMPPGVELPAHLSQTFEETARRRLDDVLTELKKAGHVAHAHVRTGDSAKSLLLAAEELQASEIVIGHKSYENTRVLGPNASHILRHAHVPVTVVP